MLPRTKALVPRSARDGSRNLSNIGRVPSAVRPAGGAAVARYMAHQRRMDTARTIRTMMFDLIRRVAMTHIFVAVFLWWRRLSHRCGHHLSLDANHIRMLRTQDSLPRLYWIHMQHSLQRAIELTNGTQHSPRGRRQLPPPPQRRPLAPVLSSVANSPYEMAARSWPEVD